MRLNKKYISLFEALLCTLGFIVFAYFIHVPFPGKLISFAGLLIPAYIISRHFYSLNGLRKILGITIPPRQSLLFIITGILLGVIYAAAYRNVSGISIFPKTIRNFAAIAALIGTLEEIVFRGFMQGHVRNLNAYFSIFYGSISHTAYKCFLFLSPAIAHKVDVPFLLVWTLTGGLIFGVLKEYSKSTVSPVIAHALFDILAYAECVNAPWWVW
jgi:membrane protease YdiL (CAAX protease family)